METRTERTLRKRKKFWKDILSPPKLLLFLILSFILYMLSMITWVKAINDAVNYEMLISILTVNIVTVSIFMVVGFANIKPVVLFVKSLGRIAFTVWVVLLVQHLTNDQAEQNLFIIICTLFIVYLEVLLDINDMFHQITNYQSIKFRFLNTKFLQDYSIPLSILTLAIMNVILSSFIENFISIF
ncbi:hypothetical protein D3P09_04920 [Paenibacillus pinisoli]|uniref:Uncharacterized protein n=1 Tax=Paenibacillus pinisoli TaxID=1276110 RepID=A0A3A6PPL4_9BACL|nr:hypothetical protein D3P09_04920 [Paenibacillus pinisoli]